MKTMLFCLRKFTNGTAVCDISAARRLSIPDHNDSLVTLASFEKGM